jgi:hypothetical protein
MRKLCLFILVVSLLSVTSSFAAPPPTGTVQRLFIAYAPVVGEWWSGLVIHNTSDGSRTFSIRAFREDGTYKDSASFSVAAYAMKVDVVENFFGGTPPSPRMSLRIQSSNYSDETFRATLFVGNAAGGFGFQNYISGEYTYPLVMTSDPVD